LSSIDDELDGPPVYVSVLVAITKIAMTVCIVFTSGGALKGAHEAAAFGPLGRKQSS
jgi:hypothetical protein